MPQKPYNQPLFIHIYCSTVHTDISCCHHSHPSPWKQRGMRNSDRDRKDKLRVGPTGMLTSLSRQHCAVFSSRGLAAHWDSQGRSHLARCGFPIGTSQEGRMLGDEQDFDGWRWKMKESKQKKNISVLFPGTKTVYGGKGLSCGLKGSKVVCYQLTKD